MVVISREHAKDIIKKSGGRIFTARNKKKDGTDRAMNCRLHVSKGVKGIGLKYNPEERNMVTVFDMKRNEFRTLNFDTLYQLNISHEYYEVVE